MTIDECIALAARRASRLLHNTGAEQGYVLWMPLIEAIEEECAHTRRHNLDDMEPCREEADVCARQSLEQIVLTALILYSTSLLNKNVKAPDEKLLN